MDNPARTRSFPNMKSGRSGWIASTNADTPGSQPYELFYGEGIQSEIRAQASRAPANVVHQPLDHLPERHYARIFGGRR